MRLVKKYVENKNLKLHSENFLFGPQFRDPTHAPVKQDFVFFYFENYDRKFCVLYGVCCICATVSQ